MSKTRVTVFIALFVVSSFLESCATYADLRGNLNYYVGKSISLVTHRFGQPKAMYDRPDGTTILIYENMLFDDTRSHKFDNPTGKMVYCDYDLFMSKDFKIYRTEKIRKSERKDIEDFKYYGLNE